MSDAVIVGIITAVAAVVCQIIISMSGRSAAQRERAESNRLIVYRLDQLETKVDKHNNVIERVYQLEKDADVIKEQIKVANHRIDDIEEALK
jgi:TolA-binding protein